MRTSDSCCNQCIVRVRSLVNSGSRNALIRFCNELISEYDDGEEQAGRLDSFSNYKWHIF